MAEDNAQRAKDRIRRNKEGPKLTKVQALERKVHDLCDDIKGYKAKLAETPEPTGPAKDLHTFREVKDYMAELKAEQRSLQMALKEQEIENYVLSEFMMLELINRQGKSQEVAYNIMKPFLDEIPR